MQQTLAVDRLADRVCCLHAAAVRPWLWYGLLAIYTGQWHVLTQTVQKPGAKSAFSVYILLTFFPVIS